MDRISVYLLFDRNNFLTVLQPWWLLFWSMDCLRHAKTWIQIQMRTLQAVFHSNHELKLQITITSSHSKKFVCTLVKSTSVPMRMSRHFHRMTNDLPDTSARTRWWSVIGPADVSEHTCRRVYTQVPSRFGVLLTCALIDWLSVCSRPVAWLTWSMLLTASRVCPRRRCGHPESCSYSRANCFSAHVVAVVNGSFVCK